MKFIEAVIFSLSVLIAAQGFAAEESGSGMDWQISVQPQQTAAEKEAARWTEVMENSTGRYYIAKDSVFMTRGAFGDKDRNILQAEVKTVFMNEDLKKHLDTKVFAQKLKDGDSVESYVRRCCCLICAPNSTASCTVLFTAKAALFCKAAIKNLNGSLFQSTVLRRSCWRF